MNYLAIYRYLQNNGETNIEKLFSLKDDGIGVYIDTWNSQLPKPTPDELNNIQTTLDNEALKNQYKTDRKAEYPSIGDQLDALWKGGTDATTMKTIIDNIKLKYPK